MSAKVGLSFTTFPQSRLALVYVFYGGYDTDQNATAPLNSTTTLAPWAPTQSDPPSWIEPDFPPETISQSRMLKPHPEVSVDGFEIETTTLQSAQQPEGTVTALRLPDIGSVIESFLNTARPVASSAAGIHFERSEDGWGELTQSVPVPSFVQVSPVGEGSGGGSATPAASARVSLDNGPQQTGPVTGTSPQVTSPPVVAVPQATPPPAITYSGITLQPVPVTSVRVLTVDGKPTTVSSVVNYRYVVGSATLQAGSTTTINNVAIAVSINSLGSTVLVAGDLTTTISPPAQAMQATSLVQVVKISTTIMDGTTKYLVSGQTLAPGQAVAVNGISISIGVHGRSTVLVMGDVTTTFVGEMITTTSTVEWGATLAATFGKVSGSGEKRPAATSTVAGSGQPRAKSWHLSKLVPLLALVPPFF
jgi:hypothetical protein